MPITLQINGQARSLDVEPEAPLLWVLRTDAGLPGTKFGCGMALCGACTVHLDGLPVRACSTPVGAAAGKAVTTIEGLAGPEADALRAAWQQLNVVQCGYCQSGQLMAAAALLKQSAKPDDAHIDQAMSGNLCRCGTYPRIRAAIHLAAAKRAA